MTFFSREIQVEPLEIQSKKAKEYLENKRALESIEVALLAYEIENIKYKSQKYYYAEEVLC